MADSKMTEEELYLENNEPGSEQKQSRNMRKNQAYVNSMLSNSYDNIKQKSRRKKATTTHRKDL